MPMQYLGDALDVVAGCVWSVASKGRALGGAKLLEKVQSPPHSPSVPFWALLAGSKMLESDLPGDGDEEVHVAVW